MRRLLVASKKGELVRILHVCHMSSLVGLGDRRCTMTKDDQVYPLTSMPACEVAALVAKLSLLQYDNQIAPKSGCLGTIGLRIGWRKRTARDISAAFCGRFFSDPPSVRIRSASASLDARAMLLRLDHSQLLAARLLAVPTAILLPLILALGQLRPLSLLQFRAKVSPSQQAIDGLRPFPLTSDFDTRGTMSEPDAGAGLLQLLPSPTRPDDESFVDVGSPGSKGRQPDLKVLVHV